MSAREEAALLEALRREREDFERACVHAGPDYEDRTGAFAEAPLTLEQAQSIYLFLCEEAGVAPLPEALRSREARRAEHARVAALGIPNVQEFFPVDQR